MPDRQTSPLQVAFVTRNNEGKPFVRQVLQTAAPTGDGIFGGQQFIKVFPFGQGDQGASFWLRIYAWDKTVGADPTIQANVPPIRVAGYQPSLLAELYCVLDDNPGYDGGIVGANENYCSMIFPTNGTVSYVQNPGYGIAAWAVVPLVGCNLFQFDAMDARQSGDVLTALPNALWAGVSL